MSPYSIFEEPILEEDEFAGIPEEILDPEWYYREKYQELVELEECELRRDAYEFME